MVVNGSQHALDLSARVLLDPDSPVWIEEPAPRRAAFSSHAAPTDKKEAEFLLRAGIWSGLKKENPPYFSVVSIQHCTSSGQYAKHPNPAIVRIFTCGFNSLIGDVKFRTTAADFAEMRGDNQDYLELIRHPLSHVKFYSDEDTATGTHQQYSNWSLMCPALTRPEPGFRRFREMDCLKRAGDG